VRIPRLFAASALAAALLSLMIAACGSQTGSTIGFFPIEITGNASQVSSDCGSLGLTEDDDVLIALTGNRITVRADSEFDKCRGTIFGAGEMTFAEAADAQVEGMEFSITAKDDCEDLDDLNYTDLGKVAVTFETLLAEGSMRADAPLSCADASDDPLGDRIECEINGVDGCTFIVQDPFIVYRFDLEDALEEALNDAFFG
jgi:hypothetical protein